MVHELNQIKSETELAENIDENLEKKDYHRYAVVVYQCCSEVGLQWSSIQYIQQSADNEILNSILARMNKVVKKKMFFSEYVIFQ